MVLLAAAICNKAGKTIMSRQFVEMTRARIEGLLAAFPKLMGSGQQHTFVETESVRYVYQPLEKLYMLLITTKASNILEDLETLRLFARVIPEYCQNLDESDILDQAFSLIFAFDEIVALGYRENVNLTQIRTFTEMESHEEKVINAVRQTQEREAKEIMRRKAKDIAQQKRDQGNVRGGTQGGRGYGSSYGSSKVDISASGDANGALPEPTKPSYTQPSKLPAGNKALRLKQKTKDVDSFVTKLTSEGEHVQSEKSSSQAPTAVSKQSTPQINQEGVHLRVEEKISLTAGRDGGLQNLEVHGIVYLKINSDEFGKIKVVMTNNDTKGAQLQTHPNVDKKLWTAAGVLALKNQDKPFPLHQEIGVLKWRFQTQDESVIPLSINCWPSETGSGCDVNIEYELEQDLVLSDVLISIPVPTGVGSPNVSDCDGDYKHDSRRGVLEWSLPLIDETNKSGSLEFSIPGHPDDFFPVTVKFISKRTYCNIDVADVKMVDGDHAVKYSLETIFFVDKYEIV